MNSPHSPELERRLKQLEAATSRTPVLTCGVDRETAELRESWDAFAECLKAADAAWDEPGGKEGQWVEALVHEERLARRSIRWSFALALSLTLLVIGACVWLDRLAFQDAGMLAQNHSNRTLVAEQAWRNTADATPSAPAWDWDDDLDEQLVEASETLVAIRADWYPSDRVDLLSRRMEELRNEWDGESL